MSIDSAMPQTAPPMQRLWAERAWIQGAWHADVLLDIGADGCFGRVQTGIAAPGDARRLAGPVLPGMVNAHSHAFQRAFAGLAERRSGAQDDFWGWRERMYDVAARITPEQLRSVASQLYAELLQGGYTQVCEFHYLHHAPDGRPYADEAEMLVALARAAADTGIGLTLLPVLYQRAGFAQPRLRADQRRFATDAHDVLRLRQTVRAWRLPLVQAGIAIHSLRAAKAASIGQLVQGLGDEATPIHIHVAEQTAEVDDCIAATGRRPIQWLCDELPLDARWQLVHATHATAGEIDAVARSGAGVVLCPSTEANLGDGLADLPRWLASATPLSLGSDSHVGRDWVQELRWLEYGQRLGLRQRNVAADPMAGVESSAARLLDRHLAGGAAAARFERWGLSIGARADLLVLDAAAPGLEGIAPSHTLDALVFNSAGPAFAEVWVAGRRVVVAGRALAAESVRVAFCRSMGELWADL